MSTPSTSAPTVVREEAASDVHAIPRVEGDDPLIGRLLDGRYRIEGALGAGGVGVVYQGRHLGLNRLVAIKVLRDGFLDVEVLRKRFEREAQALSALAHPNIVALTDYGISDGMPYLVMELLDGTPLEELVDPDKVVPAHRIVEIMRGVVRALAFAHQRNVLHRDLKPGNVFLVPLPDEPDHVKLLDFGLAKILEDEDKGGEEPTLTRAGTILGTPAYMAPEQASGSRVDARADVYSAGIMLYELLAGRPPFAAEKRTDVMRAHIIEAVPDPSAFRPELQMSAELEEILVRCLAKEPGQRYADGTELLEALEALPTPAATYAGQDESTANVGRPSGAMKTLEERSSSVATSVPREPERNLGWVWAALAVILIGAAGAAWALVPRETTSDSDTLAASQGDEPPRNPFAVPMPVELADLEEQLLGAESLDRRAHSETRRFQREHPDDPRPSLILAHDFANRGQWSAAVERYALAYDRNPAAQHDPRMLEDLIRATEMPAAADDSITALRNVYGDRAIEEVDRLLQDASSPARQDRLQALRQRLGEAD